MASNRERDCLTNETAVAAPLSTFPSVSCCQKQAWPGEVSLCGVSVASRRPCGYGDPGGSVRRDPCHRGTHVRRQDHRAPLPGPGLQDSRRRPATEGTKRRRRCAFSPMRLVLLTEWVHLLVTSLRGFLAKTTLKV